MLVIGWLLGLALAGAAVLGLLWLRHRRIRLQVEARYLSAVADFDTPTPDAATLFAGIRGEPARRLLRGLIGPGLPLGPASWESSGWLRYDSDARERTVTAVTYCIPGVWWAQIRRVRVRGLGWIDEIHQVEGATVSSGYWWLGLYRVDRPGLGPEPIALQAQALGEAVLVPWAWFTDGRIDWEWTADGGIADGRVAATGHRIRLQLDAAGRPGTFELWGAEDRVRIEFAGWHWLDRALGPESLCLIEGVGTVNEFKRLRVRLHGVRRAPVRDRSKS